MESINFELVLKHRQSLRAYEGYLKRINKEHAAMVPFARGHSCYCEQPTTEASSIIQLTPDSAVGGVHSISNRDAPGRPFGAHASSQFSARKPSQLKKSTHYSSLRARGTKSGRSG